MLTLSDISNGFDPATGSLALRLPLAALTDALGPGFTLEAQYSSLLGQAPVTTNLTAPTGVLGLGWDLALPQIVALSDPESLRAGRRYYLSQGSGLTELIPLRTQAGGVVEFGTASALFWVIRYDPDAERWTLIDEDGIRHIYGGTGTGSANGTETAIAWGDWSGASSQVQGQQSRAVAWHLTRIVDLWGQATQLGYAQTTGTLGGGDIAFTRAVHLTRVVGAEGGRIDLSYSAKRPDEWIPAHTAPAPPNAWQDRYDTQALGAVTVTSPGGAVLEAVHFAYGFIGSGALTKRLLSGVQVIPPAGPRPPGLLLGYQTAAGADYGCLTKVTTPLGGVAQISYTTAAPAFSDRSATLIAPADTSYAAPQLAFEPAFTALAWPATDHSKAAIAAYVWDGRWVAAELGSLATSAQDSGVTLATSGAAFAAQTRTQVQAWQRDPRQSGAWTASARTTLDLGDPGTLALACVPKAVAVLGVETARLQALAWTGSAWSARAAVTLSGAGAAPVCALAGAADQLIAAVADAADPGLGITLHRMGVDDFGQWTTVTDTIPLSGGAVTSVDLTPGTGFAVIRAIGGSGGQTVAQYILADWSNPADPFRITELSRRYLAPADPVPVPVVHGSSVALGQLLARYDGRDWRLQSIEAAPPEGAGALRSISFAPDQAVRLYTATAGGLVADLVAYDPNATAAAPWRQTLSQTCPAGDFTARAARTGDVPARYALIPHVTPGSPQDTATNAVFYQSPDGTWAVAGDLPDVLTAAELPSLQIAGNRYVVYQTGAQVCALPLHNGAQDLAAQSRITGALLIDGQAPDRLVGPTAFASYTGDWTAAPVVTLHRATPQGATGTALVPVVAKIRRLPGNTTDPATNYAVIDTVPSYTLQSAVLAPDGQSAAFNRVQLAVQSGAGTGSGTTQCDIYNTLTEAEAQSLPAALRPSYPTAPGSNAQAYLRLLAGMVYTTTQSWTDSGGTERSDSSSDMLQVTERHYLGGTYDPVGFYSRALASRRTADGVTAELSVSYDANGLPVTTSGARFDALGAVETVETTLTYFPQAYTQNTPENLLSPVVQSVSRTNGAAVAAQVTTWSQDWQTQTPAWAPRAAFVAAQPDFVPFDAWTTGATPQGWRRESLTLARTTQGGAIAQADVLGRISTNLYDGQKARITARFGVAAGHEVSYFGFEPYEASGPWSYQGSSTILGQITDRQYHTGTRSLGIAPSPPETPQGPQASFAGLGDRRYLFSCWMLPMPRFVPDDQTTRWTLQAYRQGAAPAPLGAPVVLGFPPDTGQKWRYVEAVIDLPALRRAAGLDAGVPLDVRVTGINAVPGGPAIYADNLRFAPLDSLFSAVVFDAATWLITAQLGENGDTRRTIRNGAHQTVATVGPRDDNVGTIAAMAYARSLSGADDRFYPALPNQMLCVQSASFGGYQDFDPSDAADWTLAAGWAIADRQLAFTGTSSDPVGARAELTGFVQTDYAARVRVCAQGGQGGPTVSVGTGDVFVSWTPDQGGTWLLRRAEAAGGWTTLASRAGALGEEWLFAVVDAVAFFFCDGNQIFGYLLPAPTQGKLIFGATGTCALEQLVIARDPSLSVSFIDGDGQVVQSMAMVDRQTVSVTGILFDDLGRPTVQREPVRQSLAIGDGAAQPPAAVDRTQGALTTYLPYDNTTGSQLTVAQYLDPAISGAPFNRTLLERAPMARPIEMAGPGPDHAAGSGHTLRLAYGANAAGDWLDRVLAAGAPGRSAGSYFMTSLTDPNGNLVQTATNQAGQTIAEAFFAAGSDTPSRIVAHRYDGAGRPVQTQLPNYFTPPANAADGTPWVRRTQYDFLGNVIATDGPDAGQTQTLYDSADRARFSMDAAGAALDPPAIRYVIYDALNRVVERGLLQKAGITWAGLAAHLDQPGWPTAADGAVWSRRDTFDRPPEATQQAPNQVGRLIAVTFNRSDNATPATVDTETYAYDVSGNVVTQNTTVQGFDAITRQSGFAYDNLNRAIKTVFPRPLDGAGQPQGTAVDATYFYDRLGRLASIGQGADGTEVLDPDNPNPGPKARFARNEFDARGQLGTTTLGMNSGGAITRRYAYDTAGRPVALGGDYMTQSLTYGTGGLATGGLATGGLETGGLETGGLETGGLATSADWCGRIGSSQVTYTRQPGAPDDLASGVVGTPRAWRYGYHPEGWLSGAVASDQGQLSALSAGTASAPMTYDANGTILTVPRPPATQSYDYVPQGSATRTADKIVSIRTAVAQSVDLSGGTLPPGWSFATSNAGPTAARIVTDGAAPVPAYAQIPGGTVGYAEALRFDGVFGPAQDYTIAFQWRSAAGFDTQIGLAALSLALTDAKGQAYRAVLLDLSAGASDWTTATQSFDLRAITQPLGVAPSEIVSARLEFSNAKRGTEGQAGAALCLGQIVLSTGTAIPQALQYDASGRMISNPQRRLGAIAYDGQSGRIATLTMTAEAPVAAARYTYGPTEDLSLATVTRRDGITDSLLHLRAPGGALVATLTRSGTDPAALTFTVPGRSGPLALLPAGGTAPAQYPLRDHLGSVRAIAEEGAGATAGLRALYDYGPFGELLSAAGPALDENRYGDQRLDAASGLTQFPARSYDPVLRSFLSPDAAGEFPWPYSYVGADPINRTDPSGNMSAYALVWHENTRLAVFGAISAASFGSFLYQNLADAWNNPVGALADTGEWVVGKVIIPPLTVMLTSGFGLSLALRSYANLVHYNNPNRRTVPVVSVTMAVGAAMYGEASLSAVRSVSRGYLRQTETPKGLAEAAGDALSAAASAAPAALIGSLYQHYYAPRLNYGKLKGVKNGPTARFPANSPNAFFLRADGFYAFEEYIEGISWVPGAIEQGNMNMKDDTNFALIFARPFDYFNGMRYGKTAYKSTSLVLEHRDIFGYVIFLPHKFHTPGKGGPRHIGISAVIRHGYGMTYGAFHFALEAIPPAVSGLVNPALASASGIFYNGTLGTEL